MAEPESGRLNLGVQQVVFSGADRLMRLHVQTAAWSVGDQDGRPATRPKRRWPPSAQSDGIAVGLIEVWTPRWKSSRIPPFPRPSGLGLIERSDISGCRFGW